MMEIKLSSSMSTFNKPEKSSFGSIMGEGENAGYQHFLFFPQCFQKVSRVCVVKGYLNFVKWLFCP